MAHKQREQQPCLPRSDEGYGNACQTKEQYQGAFPYGLCHVLAPPEEATQIEAVQQQENGTGTTVGRDAAGEQEGKHAGHHHEEPGL